ncbi:cytochrome P450 [Hysterangium stoloniferum]|nr:cytochrome P450 [Hysterangium stoloniferum]
MPNAPLANCVSQCPNNAMLPSPMEAWLSNAKPFVVILSICYVVLTIIRRIIASSWETKLPGPPPESWLFGVSKKLFESPDDSLLWEQWLGEYGPIYRIPLPLGNSRVVVCDPTAVAYFYARETVNFRMRPLTKIFVERLFGRSLIFAEGDIHKRQRKALAPAFSNTAIRTLSPVFFDSAYKLKTIWDSIIDASTGETLIDVQAWMNRVSLDTIGIAGFSHDFGTLQGQQSALVDVLDSFTRLNLKRSSLRSLVVELFAPVLPFLFNISTRRSKTISKLNGALQEVADHLMRKEKEVTRLHQKGPNSIIETLISSEGAQSDALILSTNEVLSQIKMLIFAGYETTSIILTWALIELCKNINLQNQLRDELSQLNTDPSFDQLTSGLPLLDSITKETLRLHPPVTMTLREAVNDEILPLIEPLRTTSGELVDNVHISRGTSVVIPIHIMNKAKSIWGDNAHEFEPSRWLSSEIGIPGKARDIHGYSHMLTFVDGPRTCLGRQFALTEMKAVLATLIRHYEFRLPDGPETKVEKVMGFFYRPRVAGEEGSRVPILVKRLE